MGGRAGGGGGGGGFEDDSDSFAATLDTRSLSDGFEGFFLGGEGAAVGCVVVGASMSGVTSRGIVVCASTALCRVDSGSLVAAACCGQLTSCGAGRWVSAAGALLLPCPGLRGSLLKL